jgi:hypothetical protein
MILGTICSLVFGHNASFIRLCHDFLLVVVDCAIEMRDRAVVANPQ